MPFDLGNRFEAVCLVCFTFSTVVAIIRGEVEKFHADQCKQAPILGKIVKFLLAKGDTANFLVT
jgi:hypothetical protein